eukprot:CAMPEP_0115008044 /NCGR_PEP_ID=MMETSP0216-20121206/21638_1 /TAXON_ID=223996 /ORGANISM="Protocruzia adherens, Strain Boccale" /LENGTH=203 /DNA_ID=CAMNT_0002375297 /DNA_START=40 /DNA_END=651 /DNA_ORIENTATION=+
MGKLTLLHHPSCPYATRVRLTLLYKGIDFDERVESLKNKSEEFLKLNPLGKVPVLILEDGTVIYESIPVMELLDKLPQYDHTPKLFPTDPVEKAKTAMKIARMESLSNGLCVYFCKGPEQVLKNFSKNLDIFQEILGDQPYFGGEAPNVVDFALIPCLNRYSSISDFDEPIANNPVVADYIKRVHKIPAVQTILAEKAAESSS